MKLYVMRHGRTVWNDKKITQGHSNNRLSKQGKEMCEKSAIELRNVKLDYIISSPLFRAVQSANIVNKYHNLKILKDNRIIDIDQGYFTGKYYEKLSQEENIAKKNKDKIYNMENYEELFLRTIDFIEYLKQNFSNDTILVVTHSGVASFIEQGIKFKKYSADFRTDLFDNAQIKLFHL